MSAPCEAKMMRDEAWDRIRRDPELLAAVLATTRPKLLGVVVATQRALATQPIRAAVMAGLLTLDTADHPEHEADQC